jgi:hypothetical protein
MHMFSYVCFYNILFVKYSTPYAHFLNELTYTTASAHRITGVTIHSRDTILSVKSPRKVRAFPFDFTFISLSLKQFFFTRM